MRTPYGTFSQQEGSGGIVVPTGLIGYWPTNNGSGTTVTATIGTNATMTGSMVWSAGPKGTAGTAIEATADSAIARVPEANSPKPSTAFSLCCWYKKTGSSLYSVVVGTQRTGDVDPWASWCIIEDPVNTLKIFGNVGGTVIQTATIGTTTNTWYFCAGTWASGGTWKFSLNNGTQVTSAGTATGSITYYGEDLGFCQNTNWNNRWARGPVANIRVYNREITTSEITEIYNSEGP